MEHRLIGTENLLVFERSIDPKGMDQGRIHLRTGRKLMNTDFYAFGEILWDCLPSGRHAGGAPFNVTAHLAQLGVTASLISAVGHDTLGDEILAVAKDKGVNVEFVSRVRFGLQTGTVLVTVDENGNATYKLVQPVAWDEISVSDQALKAVSNARAFVFGSLAGRSRL